MRFGKGILLYEVRNPTMGGTYFHLVPFHSSSIDQVLLAMGSSWRAFVVFLLTRFDLEASYLRDLPPIVPVLTQLADETTRGLFEDRFTEWVRSLSQFSTLIICGH
jgi:hypothetical protein